MESQMGDGAAPSGGKAHRGGCAISHSPARRTCLLDHMGMHTGQCPLEEG